MKIRGLQKLTLLDYPGKVACTVFLGGCNFRCPFCYNAPLVLAGREEEPIPEETFFAFLDKRRGVLDGVCVSGGEPLLSDISDFLRAIRARGFSLKLDTNGSQPERLQALCAEGLVDYVAMDVKNALPEYPVTVGIPDFDTTGVAQSIAFLKQGRVPYEFRTTVCAELHGEEQMRAISELLAGAGQYYLQSYSEDGEHIGASLHAHSPETMRELLKLVQKKVPSAQLRGL